MGRLDGKVALVTGSSSGIGRAIALGLAAEGAAVVLAARRAEQLQQVADEIGASGGLALAVPTDLAEPEQIERLFAAAVERYGQLDVLVNNAGTNRPNPLDEMTVEEWDAVLAVNLRAPFLCTRQAMRIMKRQRGGRIINIGSISASRVRPDMAAYSASKFGIIGLTHTTALEGRPYGISCGALHPGNTVSELTDSPDKTNFDEPKMQASELAQAAILMACLPPHISMLEAVVLPVSQLYIGRG